jgi:hypothetical protein
MCLEGEARAELERLGCACVAARAHGFDAAAEAAVAAAALVDSEDRVA